MSFKTSLRAPRLMLARCTIPASKAAAARLEEVVPTPQENAARQRDNHTHEHQFDVNLASALAHLNSIAYCNHNNVAHWNCTRCAGCRLLCQYSCLGGPTASRLKPAADCAS